MVRKTPKGKTRILLAHRPAYDDWALPKGKMDEGETLEETAVREVLEETGYHCRIVAPLGKTRHRVGGGTKEVAWFMMRPLPDSPGFRQNREIDRIRWLSPKEARKLADYESDRRLIAETDLKRLSRTGITRLLRHCAAGDRKKWEGDDRARPLTDQGRGQANRIAHLLEDAGIERIVSSPYARCMGSVEPLARVIGAKVEIDDRLAEGVDVVAARRLLEEVAGDNAVLCSHGDVVPVLLEALRGEGVDLQSPALWAKGSIWEIEVDGGRHTAGRYLPPPPH